MDRDRLLPSDLERAGLAEAGPVFSFLGIPAPIVFLEFVEAGGDDPCREAYSVGVRRCLDAAVEVGFEAEVGADRFHRASLNTQ